MCVAHLPYCVESQIATVTCFVWTADKGLAAAVASVFPLATHLPCCFHLLQNAKRQGPVNPTMFWLLQTSASQEEFDTRMATFATKHSEKVVQYLQDVTQPWILFQHVELQICTYGFRTSNLSEILNSTMLKTRSLPPLPLMMATTRHASDELQRSVRLATQLQGSSEQLVPYAVKMGETIKAEAMGLQGTAERVGEKEVCVVDIAQTGPKRKVFSLAARRVTPPDDGPDGAAGDCDCKKPVMLRFWCKHALVAER